jgi:hypothetical protein
MFKLVLPVVIVLSGCASTVQPTQSYSNVNAIQKVTLDCRFAGRMSQDLQFIISNPNEDAKNWAQTFNTISGSSTPQQRITSAKTVLWNIRTQCQGF